MKPKKHKIIRNKFKLGIIVLSMILISGCNTPSTPNEIRGTWAIAGFMIGFGNFTSGREVTITRNKIEFENGETWQLADIDKNSEQQIYVLTLTRGDRTTKVKMERRRYDWY